MCTFLKKYANINPISNPIAIPRKIETGIFTKLSTDAPSPCIIPTKVENRTITYTSSTDAPARISCGIPSFTPYPSSISLTILGTTTAGETAASTAPIIAASSRLNPISFGAIRIIPSNSKDAGTKHIKTAGLPIFFRPDRSSPSPALVRIMISAIFRSSDDIPRILLSNRFNTYGPRITPVANIPNKLGSLHFWQSHPMDIPTIRINAILNSMNFPPYSC